jgi:O-antigen/teichoic acid export membrane protein
VTPDAVLKPIDESQLQAASTAGMTTKVVKGSMWTLAGQIAPFAVSFISTPFIIRFLGSERYGVLLLVGLIPMYFSFADFGMGIASTKFASEAFGQGDKQKEAALIWTATAVAGISALAVAVPLFLFSHSIVVAMNVPAHLIGQANVALKIASATFVLGILASVLNSSMLARLRMDLNTVTQAVPKILLAAVTPFILYYGGGIVEAVGWAFVVAIIGLASVLFFSVRLLPGLVTPVFNPELVPALVKVGGALVVSGVAAVLLVNAEKLILVRVTSVQTLAYYGVASTLASMAIMFGTAMHQSLVPAFSQLLNPSKRKELERLYARTIRINIIGMAPLFASLFVISGPFFTLWAGPEFGSESTPPFYIMITAVLFSLWAYVPVSLVIARGRTDILAKVYWMELLPYLVLTAILTVKLGAVGAALAWSLRVLFDTAVMTYLGSQISELPVWVFKGQALQLLLCLLVLATPAVVAATSDAIINWSLLLLPLSLAAYSFIAWTKLLDGEERKWTQTRLRSIWTQLPGLGT